ncbi:flavin reductase family protein [Clostridium sp. UBA1652]|uniref:flavin reductase family protein n=1 Tax=Clostridium sp. UBA1652 TaxID=1946348 RepID=UPI000FA94440|nr:flavin reductase family protein [Clostridium sp. UBA1652]
MKEKIEVLDYAKEILQATKKGVLLTTKTDEKVNSMVISWGTLGIEWAKPIFTVFVRENRFTKHQLDKNPEFTINIPIGEFDKKIIAVCGTKSGHVIDKVKELGLTLEDSELISVPAIKEFPLTLECKVIYKQEQDPKEITEENNLKFYPQDVDSTFHSANKDYHTAYYGEIVNAYIIK